MAIVIGNSLALWNGAARAEKGLFVSHNLCCSIIPAYLNVLGTSSCSIWSSQRPHVNLRDSAHGLWPG
jgi:hypothetical protein